MYFPFVLHICVCVRIHSFNAHYFKFDDDIIFPEQPGYYWIVIRHKFLENTHNQEIKHARSSTKLYTTSLR